MAERGKQNDFTYQCVWQVTFGQLLEKRRRDARLTQKSLAEAVGISSSYVSRIEKGERFPPDRGKVIEIANTLKLDEEGTDELLLAAGYAPTSNPYVNVDLTDPVLTLVSRVLERCNPRVRPEIRKRIADFVQYLEHSQEHSGGL